MGKKTKIDLSKDIKRLLANLDKIPDELFVETEGGKYKVIWFINRQKPSVEVDYNFDKERLGVTKDGKIIFGFDSGCSCYTPWSKRDYGDDSYFVKTWKEFEVEDKRDFDKGWDEECYSNLKDYLLIIDNNINPESISKIKNPEIREIIIERIKNNKQNDIKEKN